MPDKTIPRGVVRELEEIDPVLRAALGAKYAGASMRGEEIILHLTEAASPADAEQARALALNEIGKIDVMQPAPSVRRARRLTTATDVLKGVDFADVKTQIEAITTLPQARAMMLKLLRLMWQMAVIMSLNEQDDEA